MSSSLRLALLIGGLLLFAVGLASLSFSRTEELPGKVPVEKNEGRLVAAILPVPKTSVTPTPSPTASPTATPEQSPAQSPIQNPTPANLPTATPAMSPTPGFSPSPRPTRSPHSTPTPTPTRTPKPTPTPVIDPTPKPTPVFTPKPTPVFTPKKTPTPKPFHTPPIGVTGFPPLVVVEATPKPPIILKVTPKVKKTPKPTPSPVVIGEMAEPAGEEPATGFWESIENFLGYVSPTASAQAAPAGGGVERETVDISYPTELSSKGSGTIELKFAHAGAAPVTSKAAAGAAESGIELETNRCPPDQPLSACLQDHETRVAVSLVGSGFEITSDGAQNLPKKIGEGSNPVWRWSIRPKGDVEGTQEMFLTLNFTWVKGAETLGPDASRPKDFRINVVKGFFEWGTISIAGLILSLLGPILTLPWFFERGKDLVRLYRERSLKKDVADMGKSDEK
jgi:hypothetical protein